MEARDSRVPGASCSPFSPQQTLNAGWAQVPEYSFGRDRQDPGIRGLEPSHNKSGLARMRSGQVVAAPPGHPHPTQFPWHHPTPKGNHKESLVEWGCWTLRFNPTPPLPLPQQPRADQGEGCKPHRATCSKPASWLRQDPGYGQDCSWDCLSAFRAPRQVCPPHSAQHLCGTLSTARSDGYTTITPQPQW